MAERSETEEKQGPPALEESLDVPAIRRRYATSLAHVRVDVFALCDEVVELRTRLAWQRRLVTAERALRKASVEAWERFGRSQPAGEVQEAAWAEARAADALRALGVEP